eukprot:7461530-Karenia_brevis.AAC.1
MFLLACNPAAAFQPPLPSMRSPITKQSISASAQRRPGPLLKTSAVNRAGSHRQPTRPHPI